MSWLGGAYNRVLNCESPQIQGGGVQIVLQAKGGLHFIIMMQFSSNSSIQQCKLSANTIGQSSNQFVESQFWRKHDTPWIL